MRRRTTGLALALALGLALGAASAAAESRADATWGYDLADDLMSPYCPGRALSECPSPQAEELREWILAQERAGQSREAVESELFRVFGDTLRQTPRAEGVGLVAYAIPAVVFAAGGGLLFWFLRRQRRRAGAGSAAAAPPLAPVDPELERQIEEEMRRSESAGRA